MSKLAAALAWAARGFRVFPLEENGKLPIIPDWQNVATADPAQIREWWTDPLIGSVRDYNIGTLCSAGIVVDLDVKHGEPAVRNFMSMDGDFDTLTVRTPSGGYHCYYTGPPRKTVAGIMPGVDIRSWHGMVLAPGSVIDGKPYTLEIDAPLQPVPGELLKRCQAPEDRPERQQSASVETLDTQQAIDAGIHYLKHNAPIAQAGNRNNTAYLVAAQMRDYGLSERQILGLMLQHWNDRAEPPLDLDELELIVHHADQYATSAAGVRHPDALFGTVSVPPPPPDENQHVFQFDNGRSILDIPPRPWLIPRLLMRRAVTALIGGGAAGKTTLELILAAHVALGRPFLGFPATKPGKSLLYDAEEDLDELSRRLIAICAHFRFEYADVKRQISLASGEDKLLKITNGDPPTINQTAVAGIIDFAKAHQAQLIIVGPLVELHSVREDDNVSMAYVMATLRLIAKRADAAVMIGHHTAKSREAGQAGDAAIARGASSIINSARVAFTMMPATREDCEAFSLPADERRRFVRFDDAKNNLALNLAEPVWLFKDTVRLYNGDEVGVLDVVDTSELHADHRHAIANALIAEMTGQAAASMTIAEAVTAIMSGNEAWAKLPLNVVRQRIETALASPVTTPAGRVKLHRELKGRTTITRVVID
jgi:hypothetical protein